MANKCLLKHYFIVGGSLSLSPNDEICICPGEQFEFTCQVSAHHNPQLKWLIQLEASSHVLADVRQSYVIADGLGDVQTDSRNGYIFTFNLTSIDNNTAMSVLTSTLTITIDANTSKVNTPEQATINCNQEPNKVAVVHIYTGKHLQ